MDGVGGGSETELAGAVFVGGLQDVAWASCPCPSAGRLRRNGGNPDLLIEGEQEEREGLSGDSGVPLRHMGWKPMLHATDPVCPSSSTNSGIRKVDAEKYRTGLLARSGDADRR